MNAVIDSNIKSDSEYLAKQLEWLTAGLSKISMRDVFFFVKGLETSQNVNKPTADTDHQDAS